MKILFVHTINDYTGSSKVLSDVITDKFSDSSNYIMMINNQEGFLSDIENSEIVGIYFPLCKKKVIPVLTSLLSLLYRIVVCFKYLLIVDVVYINTIKPYYAAILAGLFRKKIIWHIHEKYIDKPFSIKFMEFVLEHTNAHFIFVSKYLESSYKISTKSTSEIQYNKLSKTFVDGVSISPIENRTLNRVIMVSSLSEAKGVYNYIELAKKMPDYIFTLVLSVDQNVVNTLIIKEKTPTNLHVISKQQNLSKFYYNSDIIVNLSIPFFCIETFGLTLIEGFAFGLPAIAPNKGGPLEIVDNDVNGYTVDVSDLQLIESKIRYITSDLNIYEKFSKAALKKVELYKQ